MNWLGRVTMATTAGIAAFQRSYADPGGVGGSPLSALAVTSRLSKYDLLWSYYNNSIFDTLARWDYYLSNNRLYRHTRSVYNPARRLVDFYAGTVYPGMLTHDADNLPDGTVIAIPFTDMVRPSLRQAVGQIWKWSNWQTNKGVMVRYGAATGDVLVEVMDDVDKGKVWLDVRWPGMVTDLILDAMGNVKAFTVEYDYEDRTNPENPTIRKYKREVDKDWYRTYRDDVPYGYDGPEAWQNPYGFVPAVWVKHLDVGGDHGEPAMRNLGKWDELNALASHALDFTHRVLQTPILVSGDNIQSLTPDDNSETPNTPRQRTDIPILRGPNGAEIDAVEPPPGENLAHIEHLLAEIERDHPELTMWSALRKLSQVTGPGISRLFGDVEIYVNDARAAYDQQCIKLFQMAVAVAGMRQSEGDWGELNPGQQKFIDFDLDSYDKGDLDIEIAPRELVPLGKWEKIQVERAQVALEKEQNEATMPSGDQAVQIAQRLRMRGATEGALQTQNGPTP